MKSRMDRYRNYDSTNKEKYSRSNRNQELYKNIGSNQKYTNFTDVSKIDAFSLNDAKKNYRTREGYKTIKEYSTVDRRPKAQKDLEEFNYLYQDHENRVYDINSVLEHAKENRKNKDELEEKRKLKNTNYNILASLNKEELEKYRKGKVERNKPDEDDLRNLIDTITSKTLAGEISKDTGVDLLSDLMATNIMDKVDPKDYELDNDKKEDISKELTEEKEDKLNLSSEILDKESMKKLEQEKNKISDPTDDLMKDLDKSFYTKSMDLSDKDFDFGDEYENDKKIPIIVKVLLILILIAIVLVGVYFIFQKIK